MRRNVIKTTAAALAVTVGLSACSTTEDFGEMGSREIAGTVVGAGLGLAVGSLFGKGAGQLVGMGAGLVIGAVAGNRIGAELDKESQKELKRQHDAALEAKVGETMSWTNPKTGAVIETVVVEETKPSPKPKAPAPKVAAKEAPKPKAAPKAEAKVASADAAPLCRVFEQRVSVEGEVRKAKHRACLVDGKWDVKEMDA